MILAWDDAFVGVRSKLSFGRRIRFQKGLAVAPYRACTTSGLCVWWQVRTKDQSSPDFNGGWRRVVMWWDSSFELLMSLGSECQRHRWGVFSLTKGGVQSFRSDYVITWFWLFLSSPLPHQFLISSASLCVLIMIMDRAKLRCRDPRLVSRCAKLY